MWAEHLTINVLIMRLYWKSHLKIVQSSMKQGLYSIIFLITILME